MPILVDAKRRVLRIPDQKCVNISGAYFTKNKPPCADEGQEESDIITNSKVKYIPRTSCYQLDGIFYFRLDEFTSFSGCAIL